MCHCGKGVVILGKSLTSLDPFPCVYNGRMDWVVSYFTDCKVHGLWVVVFFFFHILISLNLERIYNNYNQCCITIIIGRVFFFFAALIIYSRLEQVK